MTIITVAMFWCRRSINFHDDLEYRSKGSIDMDQMGKFSSMGQIGKFSVCILWVNFPIWVRRVTFPSMHDSVQMLCCSCLPWYEIFYHVLDNISSQLSCKLNSSVLPFLKALFTLQSFKPGESVAIANEVLITFWSSKPLAVSLNLLNEWYHKCKKKLTPRIKNVKKCVFLL